MDSTFQSVKHLMEKYKYTASDDLAWKILKSIKKFTKTYQKVPAASSIIVNGPQGSGKSFYVETYKKILQDILEEDVSFIQYDCSSENMTEDSKEAIIEGKILETIVEANQDKKVILFLDKFEKAEKSVDTLLYEFEKTGCIVIPEKGKFEVDPDFLDNIQIILCIDNEQELINPLHPRNITIRLEFITPENFSKVVNMNLPDLNENMKNIVIVLYKKLYENMNDFVKFPSCSECMLSIRDACDLLQQNAPSEVILAGILSNMLKHPDDIDKFKVMFQSDKQLNDIINELLKKEKQQVSLSGKDTIYRDFFNKDIQGVSGMNKLYKSYPSAFDGINNIHPIAMPKHLVHNPKSVFGDIPASKWHEIMQFEVSEDGWETISQIAENGYEPYLEILKNNFTPIRLSSNDNDKKNIEYQKQKKILINERFPAFLKSLCTDGMILQDDKKLGIRIVAIKETKDNLNYYRIFSNRLVQCEEIFGAKLLNRKSLDNFLLGCLGYDAIGINGLVNALSKEGKFLKAKWDYMLFSLTSEVSKFRIETENAYKKTALFPLAKEYTPVLPGVFRLHNEAISSDGQMSPFNGALVLGSINSLALPPELTRNYLDMYDNIIERISERQISDIKTTREEDNER